MNPPPTTLYIICSLPIQSRNVHLYYNQHSTPNAPSHLSSKLSSYPYQPLSRTSLPPSHHRPHPPSPSSTTHSRPSPPRRRFTQMPLLAPSIQRYTRCNPTDSHLGPNRTPQVASAPSPASLLSRKYFKNSQPPSARATASNRARLQGASILRHWQINARHLRRRLHV